MQRLIYYFLVVAISLFSSCSYEFSEDYYKEIEVTAPTATLSLNDFENDITLTEPVNVGYQYNGDNRHRLFGIAIYINSEQIQSNSVESGSFYIDVDNLEEGEHQIKVEYYFSSGTGSLADVYNQEAYMATQEYVFNVDKSIGVAPNLTSVEIIDGTLYVNWDELTHSDFNEAYLIIENENNQQLNQILLSEVQLSSGIYNDRLSLNNALHYSIMLTNNYTSSISNEVSITIPELLVTIEILNENQHAMQWGEHPLYGNFDYYQYSNYGYNNEILDAIGGELIFDSTPVFGESINHYLYLYRASQPVGSITRILDFGKPFSMSQANEYVYNPATDAYYALETVGENYSGSIQQLFVHELNPNDLSVMSSIQLEDVESASYRNLTLDPISNNLIVDTAVKSYELNSTDLSTLNSWLISDYNFSAYNSYPHYRNGYMIIANYVGAGNFSIYNAETTALIYSADINYYFKVSDDGKYFYNQDAIYEINNNAVNFITSTDTGGSIHTIAFLSDQDKCIYSNQYSYPVIFDFNTQNKTILSEIPEVSDLQYDQSSGKVLFGQLHTELYGGHKSFINIYTVNTQTYKRLEVYDSHYIGLYFRFLNNTLIYTGGLYLDEYYN